MLKDYLDEIRAKIDKIGKRRVPSSAVLDLVRSGTVIYQLKPDLKNVRILTKTSCGDGIRGRSFTYNERRWIHRGPHISAVDKFSYPLEDFLFYTYIPEDIPRYWDLQAEIDHVYERMVTYYD